MEENNRKGTGVFYAVVGVATLVVAIIGATFAYFSASGTADTQVEGEAATVGLEVKLDKISTDATGGLIPIKEDLLTKALAGDTASGNKMCLDKDGNTVCQLYRVTVKNTGSAASTLNGTFTLTATTYANSKWANVNKNTGLTTDTAPTEIPAANLNASSVKEITTNEVFNGGVTKYYYIMVYINEINDAQENVDKGNFNGSVTFAGPAGSGTTATFSA